MPQQVDHEQRRAEVGEAALRVIARDGVAGASIRAIAGEADMSTSWITHYFDGHDDVVLQAVEQLRHYFESSCAELSDRGPVDQLRALLVASTAGQEQAVAPRALLHLTAGPVPEATRAEVVALENWCMNQLEEQITRVVEQGHEGPPDHRAAAEDLHMLIMGLRVASMGDAAGWPAERIEASIDRAMGAVLGSRSS
ncbi:MAG: TetR/AcrR family transcriptional regulator [Actinomycetia bacterium]|nr:TetR/AcrR family transcriptional regulator [Actinomycetes bacterium]